MSKSRRKSGGCTRGRYKLKKMGKGWSSARRPRGSAKPIVRNKPEPADESDESDESKAE